MISKTNDHDVLKISLSAIGNEFRGYDYNVTLLCCLPATYVVTKETIVLLPQF